MHTVFLVLKVRAKLHLSISQIALLAKLAQPNLSAYLAGRGHVGHRGLRRLRLRCRELLGETPKPPGL